MRLVIFIILTLFYVNASIASEELILKVPPLKKEQHLIRSIYRIGDDIVVNTEKYDRKARGASYLFWKLDKIKYRLTPYTIDKSQKVIAVTENSLVELIATTDGNKLYFKFIKQPNRNLSISDVVESPFLLGANNDFVFVICEDRIIEVSKKGTIKTFPFKGLLSRKWRILPRTIAVTNNEMVLAYNRGEWGGAVYLIKIEKNGIIPKAKLLLSENAIAIAIDSMEKVWIASGLNHLRLRKAGLHFYDGKTVSTIISQKKIKNKAHGKEGQATIFFPKPTSISGMIVNSRDEIVLLASEIGLFSYAPGKSLKNLWRGQLSIRYNMPQYKGSSAPQGIVEMGNKFYIASRSLGVFVFETLDNGNFVPAKQIVFVD